MRVQDKSLVAADRTGPRERFLARGIATLHDHELVALLVGTGVAGRPLATVSREIVELMDTTSGPPSPAQLGQVRGLGPAKVAAISAAFELARRVLTPGRIKVRSPADVLPAVRHYADRDRECFLAITLNGAHEVVRVHLVTVGLVNRTVVHPREVFAGAIQDRATAVIAAHNHPSGSLEPSAEDHEVTARLSDAGEILGIPLLDHIIFTDGGYYSFLEHDGV